MLILAAVLAVATVPPARPGSPGMRQQVRVIDWFPDEPPAARCLAMSRKTFTEAQIQGGSTVVQSMKSDGAMKRILAKYLSADEAAKAVIK